MPEEEITEGAKLPGASLLTRVPRTAQWFAVVGVLILGLLAFIGWRVFWNPQSGSPANVVLHFDITTDVTSGSAVEFTLTYENRDSHALKNVRLEILYPDGFRFLDSSVTSREGTGRNFDYDQIPSRGRGSIVINGLFTGIPDESKLLQAKIYYQLENSSAQFFSQTEVRVNLLAPDLNLRVSGPAQVINSQKIEYTVSYQNISGQTLTRAQLQLALPDGFEFASSSIPTLDRKRWDLDTLVPDQAGTLLLRGRMSGSIGDERVLKAELGYIDNGTFVLQNRAYFTSTIIESPLHVSYSSAVKNGIAEEGDTITFTITYVNAGREGIHNVRLGMHFEGDAVDYKHARAEGGALVGHDFLWNASSKPQLALIQPGQSGSFYLDIGVNRDLGSSGVKDPTISFNAYSSADEFADPILGTPDRVKIRSRVQPDVQVSYVSGPQPPRTDQDSQYRITLRVSDSFNELDDISFSGYLNIPFVSLIDGTIDPTGESGQVNFIDSSGRLTWRVTTLPAFSTRQVSFVVSVRSPGGSAVAMPITKSMEVSATNTFTEEALPAVRVEDRNINLQ